MIFPIILNGYAKFSIFWLKVDEYLTGCLFNGSFFLVTVIKQ